jgi:hypothetical protein
MIPVRMIPVRMIPCLIPVRTTPFLIPWMTPFLITANVHDWWMQRIQTVTLAWKTHDSRTTVQSVHAPHAESFLYWTLPSFDLEWMKHLNANRADAENGVTSTAEVGIRLVRSMYRTCTLSMRHTGYGNRYSPTCYRVSLGIRGRSSPHTPPSPLIRRSTLQNGPFPCSSVG